MYINFCSANFPFYNKDFLQVFFLLSHFLNLYFRHIRYLFRLKNFYLFFSTYFRFVSFLSIKHHDTGPDERTNIVTP